VSNDELDKGTRWIAYAQPMSSRRSCLSGDLQSSSWLSSLGAETILSKLVIIHANEAFTWTTSHRNQYISLHAYHSTGIEGNTLSLRETNLVIEGTLTFFRGFREDTMATTSIGEVYNFHQIFDTLRLSYPSEVGVWRGLSVQSLIDINSAVLRNLSTSNGLRLHAVSIGHQRVLLPQPDEVPGLLATFVLWLNAAVEERLEAQLVAQGNDESHEITLLTKIISLACDAHTKFVHIHPFGDGNGRMARIISGLVLQVFGLPPPMFERNTREEYIRAVGSATIHSNYKQLCTLHAEAVERSIDVILASQLSTDMAHE